MIAKVAIPKLDANIVEAAVGAWLVKEGAPVQKNAPLVELITDKVAFELEAPASGVLRKIVAREKSVLPVGYIIGLIAAPDEPLPDVRQFNLKLLAKSRKAAGGARTEAGKAAGGAPPVERPTLRASPAARRLAREKEIDLLKLKKTMPGKVITENLVRAWLKEQTR